MAMEEMKRVNADERLRAILEQREKEEHIRVTALHEAEGRGIERGIKEGIEKGREEGREEGVTFAQCGDPKWQRLPAAAAEALKPPPLFGHSNTA